MNGALNLPVGNGGPPSIFYCFSSHTLKCLSIAMNIFICIYVCICVYVCVSTYKMCERIYMCRMCIHILIYLRCVYTSVHTYIFVHIYICVWFDWVQLYIKQCFFYWHGLNRLVRLHKASRRLCRYSKADIRLSLPSLSGMNSTEAHNPPCFSPPEAAASQVGPWTQPDNRPGPCLGPPGSWLDSLILLVAGDSSTLHREEGC